MVDSTYATVDHSATEAVGTTGLILNMVAVIAFALCLAGAATSNAASAIIAGAVAVVSFTASLVMMVIDSRRG